MSCPTQKRQFLTEKEAKRARKAGIKSQGDAFRVMEVYRCPACGDWHVGHVPFWKRKKAWASFRAKAG